MSWAWRHLANTLHIREHLLQKGCNIDNADTAVTVSGVTLSMCHKYGPLYENMTSFTKSVKSSILQIYCNVVRGARATCNMYIKFSAVWTSFFGQARRKTTRSCWQLMPYVRDYFILLHSFCIPLLSLSASHHFLGANYNKNAFLAILCTNL